MLFKFLQKRKKGEELTNEYNKYAFNLNEIEEFNKLGKEKIKTLNNDELILEIKKSIPQKESIDKKENNDLKLEENNLIEEKDISKNENDQIEPKDITPSKELVSEENNIQKEEKNTQINDNIEDKIIEESLTQITPPEKIKPKFSYINLSPDKQEIIMNSWKNVDITKLNNDIEKGQDLINHNYTISYCDNANKFIAEIRKRYDIIIKYLIGFNNEKQGIYDKTSFSKEKKDEWRYLNNYIKLLEKIKTIKNNTGQ